MTEQIIQQPQEVYRGKVAIAVFKPETLVKYWHPIRDGGGEREILVEEVFEGIKKFGGHPLIRDIAMFFMRDAQISNTIWTRVLDVLQTEDGIDYVDFEDRMTWHIRDIVCPIPDHYAGSPEFFRRDKILRGLGK